LITADRARFAAAVWGRTALLSRAADLPGGLEGLLDPAGVDELVSARGLRTPFLRVVRAGATLADSAFTAAGGVGAGIADQVSDDKLVRLFADGATLVLQALHRTWPPITEFSQQLAAELGHPVQANAYVTPPRNQGFSSHYDVHDVFVVQLAGEKQWTIHGPVHVAPLRDQPWTDRRAEVERRAQEPPLIQAVLRPGDCLYLPRGFLHAAKALGGVSTHLTLGVHTWTRHGVAEHLVQRALRTMAQDPVVRSSLPLGVAFTDPGSLRTDVDAVREALAEAVRSLDLDLIADDLLRRARTTSRPAPVGPLRQLADADALTHDTDIALRAHLQASLDQAPGARPVLRSRAGELALSEDEVAPVKALITAGAQTAAALGLDLARRLLLAGVAVVDARSGGVSAAME
jgi:hypothetical protein